MKVRGALLALALCALVAGRVAAEPTEEQGDRLDRADALLEDRAGWDEAIALYRALLVENPDWMEPRLSLARVLSWRGDYDEALQHFDRVAKSPSAPPDLTIERAEVLSWAGRNDESRALFEQVLAQNPNDARAARGVARTYAWSGRSQQADEWYAQALGLQEDPEARQEYGELRADLKKQIGAGAFWFRDSDKFQYLRSGTDASYDWDFDTRVYASNAVIFVSHDRGPDDVLAGAPKRDRAIEARVGVERRFTQHWKGTAELGGRFWDRSESLPLARGVLEYDPNEDTAIALEMGYEDQLEHSYSLESVLRNITRSGGKVSYWSQITPAWEGYAEAGGAYLSDSNGEYSAGGSVAWRPFRAIDAQLAFAFDSIHYDDFSPFYYTPAIDLGGTLSIVGRVPIRGALSFTFDAGGGAGFSKEQGGSSFGPAYRVKAGLAYTHGAFSVAADASRAQSVRATAYTTHEATLHIGWSF